MAVLDTPPHCRWDVCGKASKYTLRGGWANFDYLDLEVCAQHVRDVWEYLETHKIDGALPVDVFLVHEW